MDRNDDRIAGMHEHWRTTGGPDDRMRWAGTHPTGGRAAFTGALLLVPLLVGVEVADRVDRIEAWIVLVATLVVLGLAIDAFGRRRMAVLAVAVQRWDARDLDGSDAGTPWDPDRIMMANWPLQDGPGWWAKQVDRDPRRIVVAASVAFALVLVLVVPTVFILVAGDARPV